MKILLLSVRTDERAAIEKWGDRHPDVDLTTAEWELHSDTVDQVAGYDGLVIQQRSQIEPDVYHVYMNWVLSKLPHGQRGTM